MQAVSRGKTAPPPSLDARGTDKLSERDHARNHQNDPDPKKGSFDFKAYKHDSVKQRLFELFHGKCAYCETFYSASAPMDVEHYRPKGAVSEDDQHPGYWWLAMSWDNLLPSCIDCNRRRKQKLPEQSTNLLELFNFSISKFVVAQLGKKDSFPLSSGAIRCQPESMDFSAETPLLLDPTRDDPSLHITFHLDLAAPLGFAVPVSNPQPSERGIASIHTYGLNRLGLVQERTRLLRQLTFLGDLVIELAAIIDVVEGEAIATVLELERAGDVAKNLRLLQDRTLAEINEFTAPCAPYSAMARIWLRSFLDRLSAL